LIPHRGPVIGRKKNKKMSKISILLMAFIGCLVIQHSTAWLDESKAGSCESTLTWGTCHLDWDSCKTGYSSREYYRGMRCRCQCCEHGYSNRVTERCGPENDWTSWTIISIEDYWSWKCFFFSCILFLTQCLSKKFSLYSNCFFFPSLSFFITFLQNFFPSYNPG